MYFSKILLSLAALVGASSAASAPSPRAFGVATSIPRGGAGPVDVDTAMKAYAGLSTLQGALDYLSPKTVNKLYGLVGADDGLSSFCQSYISGDSAGIAVALPPVLLFSALRMLAPSSNTTLAMYVSRPRKRNTCCYTIYKHSSRSC